MRVYMVKGDLMKEKFPDMPSRFFPRMNTDYRLGRVDPTPNFKLIYIPEKECFIVGMTKGEEISIISSPKGPESLIQEYISFEPESGKAIFVNRPDSLPDEQRSMKRVVRGFSLITHPVDSDLKHPFILYCSSYGYFQFSGLIDERPENESKSVLMPVKTDIPKPVKGNAVSSTTIISNQPSSILSAAGKSSGLNFAEKKSDTATSGLGIGLKPSGLGLGTTTSLFGEKKNDPVGEKKENPPQSTSLPLNMPKLLTSTQPTGSLGLNKDTKSGLFAPKTNPPEETKVEADTRLNGSSTGGLGLNLNLNPNADKKVSTLFTDKKATTSLFGDKKPESKEESKTEINDSSNLGLSTKPAIPGRTFLNIKAPDSVNKSSPPTQTQPLADASQSQQSQQAAQTSTSEVISQPTVTQPSTDPVVPPISESVAQSTGDSNIVPPSGEGTGQEVAQQPEAISNQPEQTENTQPPRQGQSEPTTQNQGLDSIADIARDLQSNQDGTGDLPELSMSRERTASKIGLDRADEKPPEKKNNFLNNQQTNLFNSSGNVQGNNSNLGQNNAGGASGMASMGTGGFLAGNKAPNFGGNQTQGQNKFGLSNTNTFGNSSNNFGQVSTGLTNAQFGTSTFGIKPNTQLPKFQPPTKIFGQGSTTMSQNNSNQGQQQQQQQLQSNPWKTSGNTNSTGGNLFTSAMQTNTQQSSGGGFLNNFNPGFSQQQSGGNFLNNFNSGSSQQQSGGFLGGNKQQSSNTNFFGNSNSTSQNQSGGSFLGISNQGNNQQQSSNNFMGGFNSGGNQGGAFKPGGNNMFGSNSSGPSIGLKPSLPSGGGTFGNVRKAKD